MNVVRIDRINYKMTVEREQHNEIINTRTTVRTRDRERARRLENVNAEREEKENGEK